MKIKRDCLRGLRAYATGGGALVMLEKIGLGKHFQKGYFVCGITLYER